MVGFKTVWITLVGLLLLAACVPQTKQTECRSNEAFNATLRSCVPVVGGPTSFIKIDTASPAQPISVYKNDSNVFPLSVTVSNPYAQAYTIEWEKVYFGTPSFFAGNTLTTSFIPLSLASEIGPHFITAKVVAGGEVVDSHTFQVTISDTPRPVIDTSTITPSSYAVTLTPVDPAHQFSFTVKNNNSVVSGAGYKVTWSVTKNGVAVPGLSEVDSFTNVSSNGTNTFYLGTSNPAGWTFIPANLGVGNYVVKAVVGNTTPGETVGEQQWSVTIQHPALSGIASRNLYENVTTPAYSTTVVAYNNIAYSDSVVFEAQPRNFVPVGQTTQADFCVEVYNGDGTYAGDGQFVRVDYYLDNTTLVYSALTTAVDNKVCLTDAPGATLNLVTFANTTTTTAQSHTLVARVFDVATSTEYAQANMAAGLGTYPITWNFNVKPQNEVPSVAFYSPSGSTASCTADALSPLTVRNCSVTQGTAFTVGLTVTDDFYNTFNTYDAQYTYSFQLRRNGTPMTGVLTSCTKAAGNVNSNQDITGTNDWTGPNFVCRLTVPHFDSSNVQVDPGDTFDVIATISDVGSPIVATPASSVQMRWNLTVTETTTAPVIAAFDNAPSIGYGVAGPATAIYQDGTNASVVTIPENNTIRFRVEVTDAEGDNFTITASKYDCVEAPAAGAPATCTTATAFYTSNVTNDAGNGAKRVEFIYTPPISETLIGDPLLATCGGTDGNPSSCVMRQFFKIEVQESTHAATPATTAPVDIYQNFSNVNSAPSLSGTVTPSTGSVRYVMSGIPITLYAGSVTDSSPDATENTPSYKWYACNGVACTWEEIPGAIGANLVWTPDNKTSNWNYVVRIKVCYSDGSKTYPISSASTRCSSYWTLRSWNSWHTANTTIPQTTSPAITRDAADSFTYYTALKNGVSISVSKRTVDPSATGYNPYVAAFSNVSFTASDSVRAGAAADANSIRDLSLATTTSSLLIAYRMALTSDTGTYRIAVRNIDKSFTGGSEEKGHSSFSDNTAKFGFDYDGITIDGSAATGVTTNCEPTSPFNCSDTDTDGDFSVLSRGNQPVITVSGVPTQPLNGESIVINGATVTFSNVVGTSLSSTDITNKRVCVTCTTDQQATQIAQLINDSDEPLWQGLTANSAASSVTINGSLNFDYLDLTGSNITSQGSIHVDSTHWYIPFANGSLAGGNQNKISFMSGPIPVAGGVISTATSQSNFTTTLQSTSIKSGYYSNAGTNHVYVAAINQTGAGATLYRFTVVAGAATFQTSNAILDGIGATGFTDIRVAPPTASNEYVHVLAKDTSGKWWFGRYGGISLTETHEFQLSSKATATTAAIINDTLGCVSCDVADMQISTFDSAGEARVVITSDQPSAGNYLPYVLRVFYDSGISDYRVQCDHLNASACYSFTNMSLSSSIPFAISPTSVASGAIGSVGATASENNKQIVFGAFPSATDLSTFLINGKNESITANDRNTTDGHWRPAIVAD